MTRPINIAIIGCGYWGVNYVRVVSELPSTHVALVCDQSEARLQEVRKRFGNIPTATNVEDVLARTDIDAAIICTTAASHYSVAKPLLQAGIPLLIEKPLVVQTKDAEELIELAEQKGVILMVGHIFLFNSGIQKVKEYIQQSQLGEIYYLYARRTNLGPIRRDVNVFWDLATHDISIFNYFLDSQPEWVTAVGGKVLHNKRDDVGFATLAYPNGVLGHVHVSWADPTKVREVVVVGSKMRVAFDDLDLSERVRVFNTGVTADDNRAATYGEFQSSIHYGDIISPHLELGEPLKNQILNFIECVTENKTPITDGRSGLAVVRSLEAIEESIRSNGSPIQLMKAGVSA